jgi:hypothetical protein
MFTLRLGLLVSTAAGYHVDVRAAFRQYCSSFCGKGGYSICDIGSGNMQMESMDLVNGTAPFFVETAFNESDVGGPVPATNAEYTSDSASCNEAHGNTCLHGGHDWTWCNYRQYKCMAKYVSVGDKRYSNIKTTKQPGAGGFVFTHYVDNAFNHEQTSTVEFNEATTATASMTLGTTVSVGTEISFTEKAPVGLDSSIKASMKMDISSSHSRTVSKTQGWKISQPVTVPPRSTAKVQMIITKVKVSGDWGAQVRFPQKGKVWCNNKVNGHNEWFVSASQFLPKYNSHACHGDYCYIKGKFEGWHGVDSQIKLTPCKLHSKSCSGHYDSRRRHHHNVEGTDTNVDDAAANNITEVMV